MRSKFYHNPKCSKSREALALLQSKKISFELIDYQKLPPTLAELKALAKCLNGEVQELLRSGDVAWKETGQNAAAISASKILQAIAAQPQLLQRPIFWRGEHAVIGRPPQKILELIKP